MERVGLRVKEAAELMGVSPSWLYERIREGCIPCVEIAGRKLVSAEGIRKMFAEADNAVVPKRNRGSV